MTRMLNLLIVFVGLASSQAYAADTWLIGKITNVTSLSYGLLIQMDTGLPDNCAGSPYGWMLIPEANKTMLALAMTMWVTGRTDVVVYTNQIVPGGYCTINQFDPV